MTSAQVQAQVQVRVPRLTRVAYSDFGRRKQKMNYISPIAAIFSAVSHSAKTSKVYSACSIKRLRPSHKSIVVIAQGVIISDGREGTSFTDKDGKCVLLVTDLEDNSEQGNLLRDELSGDRLHDVSLRQFYVKMLLTYKWSFEWKTRTVDVKRVFSFNKVNYFPDPSAR